MASSRFASRNWIRSVTSWRFALRFATANAAGEMSVATKFAAGSSLARAMVMQPEPVPMSAICSPEPSDFWGRLARSSRRARRSRATSITCSVSGRGIRTSGVTSNSRPQNSCIPVRCWVGSPAARRAIRSKKRCASASAMISSGCAYSQVRLRPRTWRRSSSAARVNEGTLASRSWAMPFFRAARTFNICSARKEKT